MTTARSRLDGDTSHRSLGMSVLGGVACGGLMLLAASRTWSVLTLSTPGAPTDAVSVTGTEAVPLTGALALVVLAGSVAILPTAGRLRRGIGVVLVVAGMAAAVAAATAEGAVSDALADAVADSPGSLGAAVSAGAGVAWWRWLVVLAGLLASVVGVATAWHGHTWAEMGRRYDAPTLAASDEGDPWQALDAGHDPTV